MQERMDVKQHNGERGSMSSMEEEKVGSGYQKMEEKSSKNESDKKGKKTLQRYQSKLERSFVLDLYRNPDYARQHVLEKCDILTDICTVLMAWGKLEGTYGIALDKIIVSANTLNSLKGASGMVSAIAAVVGSFQSLGKHYLGLQQSILSQVSKVLQPLTKDQKKQIMDLTNEHMLIQKDATQLRSSLSRLKEKPQENSGVIEQASRQYRAQTKLQKNSLKSYLSRLCSIWFHRVEILNSSLASISDATQHVLNFSDEVVTALESIVSSIDVEAELFTEAATIVDIPKKSSGDRPYDGGTLAGLVYEALGSVEPDAASASVNAATVVCDNSVTICQVAQRVTTDLANALEQRGKDMDALASALQLQHLNVSCEYSDVHDEDETKETERQAWRLFMVTAKQNAMVLADISQKLRQCASRFGNLVHANEAAKKQIVAARNAAHKELQKVAQLLKDVRARLDACDENITKTEQLMEKVKVEINDLEVKLEKKSRRSSQNSTGGMLSSSSSVDSAKDLLEEEQSPMEGQTISENNEEQPKQQEDEVRGNVVQRLFGLSSQTIGERLVDAKSRYAKLEEKLQGLREQRESINGEFQICFERLESQIKAYAVQIAGTVSGFISVHAARLREMKQTLETMVKGTMDYNTTNRQLQIKMTNDIGNIDPVKDITLFIEQANKNPQQPQASLLQVPVQLRMEGEGRSKANWDGADSSENEEEQNSGGGDRVAQQLPDAPSMPSKMELAKKNEEQIARSKSGLSGEFGLPPEEVEIGSYSCAYLPGKVPQQGRIVLTKRFLCFSTLQIYEPMFGNCKVVVELDHIVKVTKAASAWGLVANSLVVTLSPLPPSKDTIELFFTSLFYRDKLYGQLVELSATHRDLVAAQQKEDGDNVSQKITENDQKWVKLDPRLGGEYKGNNLVNQLIDTPSSPPASSASSSLSPGRGADQDTKGKKKRSSGFLRLGLSATDLDEIANEVKAEEEQQKLQHDKIKSLQEETKAFMNSSRSSLENTVQHDDDDDDNKCPPFTQPCKVCKAVPHLTKPCKCWKKNKHLKDSIIRRKDHKEVSTSYWQGSLLENVLLLWMGGVDKLDGGNDSASSDDIAKALGQVLGDYDQDFPPFREPTKLTQTPMVFKREADGYAKVQLIKENEEKDDDHVVFRVVSFSHPIGNMAFGKQVAKTTQIQLIRGLVVNDKQVSSVNGNKIVEMNCDTALCGFPYADSFVVRSRYVLSEMSFGPGGDKKSHPKEFWCQLDATVRVVWLKSVSVPFLQGKIERENLQTGKKNFEAWEKLARQSKAKVAGKKRPTIQKNMEKKTSEKKEEEKEVPQDEEEEEMAKAEPFELKQLVSIQFYESAWIKATDPQRLQIFLLVVMIMTQLFIIFFK